MHSSPLFVPLQSQLPEDPIEPPASWAWGQHPANGLGYKAKDGLSLSVCLANPAMIATAKCKLPLDVCLANPEYLPLVGCAGHAFPLSVCLQYPDLLTKPGCAGVPDLPLDICLENPQFLTTSRCAGNKFPLDVCLEYPDLFSQPSCADNITPSSCAKVPELTLTPLCAGALDGFQPSLFDCMDNKEALCKLKLCEKHQFLVKC